MGSYVGVQKIAAKRIGFSAELKSVRLGKLIKQQTPAVLFLRDGKVCVLRALTKNVLQVIYPNFKTKFLKAPFTELKKSNSKTG